MRELRGLLMIFGAGLMLPAGCGQDNFAAALPGTKEDAADIRDDDDLEPHEKRAALEQMGFEPLIINAVLVEERTANQFGGELRTAWDKVTQNRLTELTPDEVQIYADASRGAGAVFQLELTDAEAQAVVDFFDDESISSKSDLITFLNDPTVAPPSEIPTSFLEQVFRDFDPNALIEQL